MNLTPRERDVLRLVAEDLTNKEIGARLGISPSTVAAILQGAYTKTGQRSRLSAARAAGMLSLA